MEVEEEKKTKKIYTCTCGFSTKYINCFRYHLSKLVPCASRDDVDFDALYRRYVEKKREKLSYQCNDCGQEFKNRSSKYRHKCKPHLELRKEVLQLEIDFFKMNKVEETYICPFNKEDTTYLTPVFLNQCLRRRNKGHIELVQFLYFSCKKNRNLKRSKVKSNIDAYEGDSVWVRYHDVDIMKATLDKTFSILQNHYQNNYERLNSELSESLVESIEKYIKQYRDNDLDTYLKLCNALKKLIDVHLK